MVKFTDPATQAAWDGLLDAAIHRYPHPTDFEADVERVEAAFTAMAAHVERLTSALIKIDEDLEGRNFLDNSSLRDTCREAIADTPTTSLAQHDAAVRREFAEAVWNEMLKHQKVIKVLPLTMAKEWNEAGQGGSV